MILSIFSLMLFLSSFLASFDVFSLASSGAILPFFTLSGSGFPESIASYRASEENFPLPPSTMLFGILRAHLPPFPIASGFYSFASAFSFSIRFFSFSSSSFFHCNYYFMILEP